MSVQLGAAIASRADFAVSCRRHHDSGVGTLQRERELERFLPDVGKRALRIAEISVRDCDEALDLVQDAMIRLVRRYARRPAEEWTALFYRIPQNGVRDWHRRQFVRNRVIAWFGSSAGKIPGTACMPRSGSDCANVCAGGHGIGGNRNAHHNDNAGDQHPVGAAPGRECSDDKPFPDRGRGPLQQGAGRTTAMI